jgi:anti-sigma B factor antagonist
VSAETVAVELYYHAVERDVLVLKADGGLNEEVAEQMEAQLATLVFSGVRKVLVDCGGLRYISSTGVRVLMRVHRHLAERGGDVRLAAVDSFVVRVLEIARLNQHFRIYTTADEALAAFREEAQA